MGAHASSSNLAAANVRFAWSLYQQLVILNADKNAFFSPFSISAAMAMTYLGAKGNTAAQLNDALEFDTLASGKDVHEEFSRLLEVINNKDSPNELKSANSLFARKDYPFLKEYLAAVKKYYDANATNLDFASNSEGSRAHINKWVDEYTAGKIKDLIPPGAIDALTALVLVNAIYFKGQWADKFDPKATTKGVFHRWNGQTKEVSMMRASRKYGYAVRDDLECRVLEMPYEKNNLTMMILLPNEINGLEKLEGKLTSQLLLSLLEDMNTVKVSVSIPKFKLESSFDLGGVLQQLKIKDAFVAGKADFSGMDGSRELFISMVVHKAFVDVNEEGTEAAAATGVVIQARSMMIPHEFIVDHPFIFMICDDRTHSILFMGRMVDFPN